MTNPEQIQVFAIIPAAGLSKRMGQPKQLLSLGGRTMLEHVIETVLRGEMDGLCVVTSGTIDKALDLSEDPRFIVALNDDGESEMINSIRIGMAALNERCQVRDIDAYLVCPGDMPQVSTADVCAVTGAYRAEPGSIVIAAHSGTRGHPMAFPVSLAPEVEQITGGGLKVLIKRHPERVRLVECDSPGVIQNINTPDDFDRLTANNEG